MLCVLTGLWFYEYNGTIESMLPISHKFNDKENQVIYLDNTQTIDIELIFTIKTINTILSIDASSIHIIAVGDASKYLCVSQTPILSEHSNDELNILIQITDCAQQHLEELVSLHNYRWKPLISQLIFTYQSNEKDCLFLSSIHEQLPPLQIVLTCPPSMMAFIDEHKTIGYMKELCNKNVQNPLTELCVSYDEAFAPYVILYNRISQQSHVFPGDYIIRVIAYKNTYSNEPLRYLMDNEIFQYNSMGNISTSQTRLDEDYFILKEQSNGYRSGDGYIILNNMKNLKTTWQCGRKTPCYDIKPKFPNVPDTTFLR
ncbi:unnamed protein product [Didymodactylos carnosus]|uniref:CATSPERG C-terminal domain-containing protein n=1 Tax=Didymodactylos carnosus TaxID=1234261 RepID=A0A8S2F302_9BILA|nr:unnamed protein product [Didymodactylos carnosus]CAF4150392.1 unnamed protein product [Didymodactylos carnosus]